MSPRRLEPSQALLELLRQAVETILAHSISDLELEAAVEGLDAGELLMVIDACNSGQALEAEETRAAGSWA